jgi:hypothetical protein
MVSQRPTRFASDDRSIMAYILTEGLDGIWRMLIDLPTSCLITLLIFTTLLVRKHLPKISYALLTPPAHPLLRPLQHLSPPPPFIPRPPPLALLPPSLCNLNASRKIPHRSQRLSHQVRLHSSHCPQRTVLRQQHSMERHLSQPPQPPQPPRLRA